MKRVVNKNSDWVGIVSSALCLVHCLIVPFIIITSSFTSVSLPEHWHWMDYLFVLLALVAAYFSSKKAHSSWVRVLLWITAGVFSVSILLHEKSEVFLAISGSASLVLIVLHFVNLGKARGCPVSF